MTDESLHLTCLGLGSNLGDSRVNVLNAIQKIEELIGCVLRRSTLYITEPWGFESDNHFVNAVVLCSTNLSPQELLHTTQKIERNMGRRKKSVGGVYHDRVIDIDILLYDDLTICEKNLKVPHPLMWQRDFVMTPLNEILPGLNEQNCLLSAFAISHEQTPDNGRSENGVHNA